MYLKALSLFRYNPLQFFTTTTPRYLRTKSGSIGRYNPGQYNPGKYDPGRYDPGRYDPGRYDAGRYSGGRYDSSGRYIPDGSGAYKYVHERFIQLPASIKLNSATKIYTNKQFNFKVKQR